MRGNLKYWIIAILVIVLLIAWLILWFENNQEFI